MIVTIGHLVVLILSCYAQISIFSSQMAPGDLNLKKSWNPALIKNQTKIWKQEQKLLEEFKRIKEKQQEYEQEKNDLELLSLKYKNKGTISKDDKLKLSKMDWMYEGPEVLGGTSGNGTSTTSSKTGGISVVKNTEELSKPRPAQEMRSLQMQATTLKHGPVSTLKKSEIDLLDPMSQIKKQMMMAQKTKGDRVDKHKHSHKHGHGHKHGHRSREHRSSHGEKDGHGGSDSHRHRDNRKGDSHRNGNEERDDYNEKDGSSRKTKLGSLY